MPVSLLQPVTKRSICGSRMHYFKHHLRLDPLLHGIDQSDDSPRSKAEPVTSRGSGSYAILRPFDGLKQTERERARIRYVLQFCLAFSFLTNTLKTTTTEHAKTATNKAKQKTRDKNNITKQLQQKQMVSYISFFIV